MKPIICLAGLLSLAGLTTAYITGGSKGQEFAAPRHGIHARADDEDGKRTIKCYLPDTFAALAAAELKARGESAFLNDTSSLETLVRRMNLPEAGTNAAIERFVMKEFANIKKKAEHFLFAYKPSGEKDENGDPVLMKANVARGYEYATLPNGPKGEPPAVSLSMPLLEGCTGLFIINRKGFYSAHYWEVPSFSFDKDDSWLEVFPGGVDEAFKKIVLVPLKSGDPGHQQSLTEAARFLGTDPDTKAFILRPAHKEIQDYDDLWKKLEETVLDIMPFLRDTIQTIDYAPITRSGGSTRTTTGRGKAVFKYDSNHDGNGGKMAALWFEKRQLYMDTWS